MKTAKMLKIYGRVQGVFFRESMKDEAKRIGVSGWVRNRKDGTVEAFVQGEAALVDAMIAWAKWDRPVLTWSVWKSQTRRPMELWLPLNDWKMGKENLWRKHLRQCLN